MKSLRFTISRCITCAAAALAVILSVSPATARAEVSEVRVAYQFGLVYLPIMVMQRQQLLEKRAKAAGLGDVTAKYSVLSGGNTMNDALLSDSIHFASGGIPPFLTLWAKTLGSGNEVKGVAGFTAANMYLLTNNPEVKSIRDFTAKDKIALPAVKVSVQAIILQMAAAKAFGETAYAKLDPLTVAMPNPDGMAALVSGGSSGVTSNFTAPPYSTDALASRTSARCLPPTMCSAVPRYSTWSGRRRVSAMRIRRPTLRSSLRSKTRSHSSIRTKPLRRAFMSRCRAATRPRNRCSTS